ncbi:MAG TPA: SRPBCC family protein [Steroidobacteraceae bacterium]|nr:SRPBCC family protein [Steroidobacteraceae bacterium]
MRYRTLSWLAAFGAAGLFLAGSDARAADYATVVLSVDVARPADAVWKKIGGFCVIGGVLKMNCAYTSGNGDLGTVRRLTGRFNVDEVMVAQTSRSYTYTQPDTKNLYHGTVAVESTGADSSKITYSVFYDQSALKTDEDRAKARDRYTKAFTGALDTMKKMAEGG